MTTATVRATLTARAAALHLGRRWRAAPAAVLASAALLATAAPQSEQVVVTGAVKTPLTLKPDDLRAFPVEQIGSVTVSRRVDGAADTGGSKEARESASTVRGVRLAAVLERAGLAATGRNEWKHTVVLATATDGYRVVFSWPELFNTETGSAVLVVFERDGQPLGERDGRIALVSGRDLRTGPRSVRWLARIDVRQIDE